MSERPASETTVPLAVPRDARTVVLFGGTFDPPHRAHAELAINAARRIDPGAWVVFVPAARSPLKTGGPVAPDGDRVAMLTLGTRGLDRCVLWTEELRRAGTSYTVESVREAKAQLPRADVRLLIGSDQAADFHRWREARELVRLTRPVVMIREPHTCAEDVVSAMRGSGFWTEEELGAWRGRVDPGGRIPLAATNIRERLASGRPDHELARDLDPGVLAYIRDRGLYR